MGWLKCLLGYHDWYDYSNWFKNVDGSMPTHNVHPVRCARNCGAVR